VDDLDRRIRSYRRRDLARRTVLKRAFASASLVIGGFLAWSAVRKDPAPVFGHRGDQPVAVAAGDPPLEPRRGVGDAEGIDPRIVGTWRTSVLADAKTRVDVGVTYHRDGRYDLSLIINPGVLGEVTVDATGTWKTQDGLLVTKINDETVTNPLYKDVRPWLPGGRLLQGNVSSERIDSVSDTHLVIDGVALERAR